MNDDVINIIKFFNSSLDFSYLDKLVHSLQLNHEFYFAIYDLIKNRFIYSNTEEKKVFVNLPSDYLNKDYLYLKNLFHPLDFANLIKEILILMQRAEYSNKKIIKAENGGTRVRIESKNGEWRTIQTHLIYIDVSQEQVFKVLLVFIEEDALNQGINITTREKEIFKLLSSGFSAKMIADQLDISVTTVITHRKNLIHKLHARNSAELIKKGFELNLIN